MRIVYVQCVHDFNIETPMNKELFNRYFRHEATLHEEEQLLKWLDDDPAHYDVLNQERRIFDALLFSEEPQVKKHALWTTRHFWTQVASIAAAVVVAFGIGMVATPYFASQPEMQYTQINVPAGQRVDVTLADGTEVCLNALSSLRFPQNFQGDTREVTLDGEGYFDVAHDKDHPFIVKTKRADVRVLGTEFDVTAFTKEADEHFEVSLVEGAVLLHDNMNQQEDIRMVPDQTVALQEGQLVAAETPVYKDFAWRDGILSFHDEDFVTLLSRFESTFGVRIVNLMQDIPEASFTGKIRIDEGVDHALWVLLRNCDFNYFRDSIEHSTIYIQDKK